MGSPLIVVDVYKSHSLKAIANGGTVTLGTIPKDALIVGNVLDVAVAFDDTGAVTGQLGDGTTAARFAAAGVDLKTKAVTRAATGVDSLYAVTTEVTLTVASANGDGALGRATWYIEYLRPDASHGVS